MVALEELQEETEKSYTALLESNKKSEEKLSQLLSENKLLTEKLENVKQPDFAEEDKVSLKSM